MGWEEVACIPQHRRGNPADYSKKRIRLNGETGDSGQICVMRLRRVPIPHRRPLAAQPIETRTHSLNIALAGSGAWSVIARAALAAVVVTPFLFLGGCMTPEDRAFYGRGWINPSELDQDETPPTSITDPTDVEPHMMGPGNY